MTTSQKVPLWTPQQEQIERANLTLFAREVIINKQLTINTWPDFYQWSVDNMADFWSEVWDFCEIVGHKGDDIVHHERDMLQCRWFPQAQLNYAQNLLRWNDHTDAIIFWTENGCHSRMSWAELTEQVKQVATTLLQWGIQPQDRIAAVVPNIPQTVVMALACAAIGATWASCSPDFGTHGIVDRFAQITPKVLILSDGYLFKGKKQALTLSFSEIATHLSSVQHVVLIPYINPPPSPTPRRSSTPSISTMISATDTRSKILSLSHFPFVIRCRSCFHLARQVLPNVSYTALAER